MLASSSPSRGVTQLSEGWQRGVQHYGSQGGLGSSLWEAIVW